MPTRAPLHVSKPAPTPERTLASKRAFEEGPRTESPKLLGSPVGPPPLGPPGAPAGGADLRGGFSTAAPIQRLSIPGLAESAIRLHPGARHKLDAFTKNRRVRQVRAVLGNLGLAGGIRGKDARHAFKSQIAAEKKWNARFGLDEKPEAGGEESSKARCCADGSSPFPENRHDASRHDPA
ncbi:MAG: hypothetical protein AAGF23_21050, partial [Acidobacteriota bacterium]